MNKKKNFYKVIKSNFYFLVTNKCFIVKVFYITLSKFKQTLKCNENKYFKSTNMASTIL